MTAAEIAVALGAAIRSGAWWRARCPVHHSRGSTLALRDGDRRLVVKCFAGCDPRDILAELRRRGLIGDSAHDRHRPSPVTTLPDEREGAARRIAMAQRIWDAAQDARGTPVVYYCAGRRITVAPPPVLRYAPALRRPEGSYGPAMVARVDDLDGRLIGAKRKDAVRAIDPETGRQRIVRDDFTGKIEQINGQLLRLLLDAGYTPVVAPLALGQECERLNIDGDRAAAMVAGALHADHLIILSNVPGLLANFPDRKSVV